jgi:hypothetical protein
VVAAVAVAVVAAISVMVDITSTGTAVVPVTEARHGLCALSVKEQLIDLKMFLRHRHSEFIRKPAH